MSRGDWASAEAELGDMGCDDDDALIWWCYTRSLLEGHSDAVVRLARALMDAGWLDGDEIAVCTDKRFMSAMCPMTAVKSSRGGRWWARTVPDVLARLAHAGGVRLVGAS